MYHRRFAMEAFREAELGRFLPHVDGPVLRIPHRGRLAEGDELLKTRLYDIRSDYAQAADLAGCAAEEGMVAKLTAALREADAPVEQYERLGLPAPEPRSYSS
jgi:hypothetical protein